MKKKTQKILACLLAAALVLSGSGLALAANAQNYYTDLTSLDEALSYSEALNIQIEEEGMVLLKNDNGALPLSSGDRITLFGNASYESVWGETGGGNHKTDYTYLTDSLVSAGLEVNPKVAEVYNIYGPDYIEDYSGRLEIPFRQEIPVSLLENARGSYLLYHDAAIVTIARNGHEDFDIPTTGETASNGAYDGRENAHALQLENNELAMIQEMRENFDKVIVLLNVPSIIEIGDWAEDVDAIVYIGLPGQYGLEAVGRVLTGQVSPSGRTVDVYAADLTQSPSYVNSIANTGVISAGEEEIATIEYEEGIYVGYKYYETVYAELAAGNLVYDEQAGTLQETGSGVSASANRQANADAWYADAVVYPFGYGLSYTTFQQTLLTTSAQLQAALESAGDLDDTVELSVKVKNTGSVPGKEVVQIYVSAPYTAGEIEKAAVSLVGFAKTEQLAPGQEQTLTVSIRLGDIASFDDRDANGNGFRGYEMEAGSYDFRLQADSHTVLSSLTVAVASDKTFDENGDATNTPFSDGNDYDTLLINENGGSFTSLSRAHLVTTFPTAPDGSETYSEELATLVSSESRYLSLYTPENDDPSDPWYTASVPDTWTQSETGGTALCSYKALAGLDDQDDVTVLTEQDTSVPEFVGKTPAQAWELFLNSLSYQEMVDFLSNGGGNFNALESVALDKISGSDGPEQLSNDGTFWACAAIMAGTFNRELWHLRGVAVGNEAMLLGYAIWYGPAVNIHRTHFNGRNYIYFSEDGFLSGQAAAEMIAGAQSKGLVCALKHIVLNDQETNRKGMTAWITEQALREIYLKPFEIAIKAARESDTAVMLMSAMNRVGAINCYSNYALLTQVVREEWGFNGAIITDTYDVSRGKANYIQRVGGDIPYGSYSGENVIVGTWDAAQNMVVYDTGSAVIPSPTQWAAVRNAAQHLLHVFANSNAVQNSLNTSLFTPKTITVQAYVPASDSIAVDAEAFGGTTGYFYAGGELPEGLSVTRNGEITGMTSQVGTHEVQFQLVGDGWVTDTETFTIEVLPFLSTTAALEGTVGEAFSTTFFQDAYTPISASDEIAAGAANLKLAEGETATLEEGKVVSFSYALLTEVPGLEMAEDGTLSGTPTQPGEYEITVRFDYLYMTDIHGPGKTMFNIGGPASYDSTYTLVIHGDASDDAAPAGESGASAAASSGGSTAALVVSIAAIVVAAASTGYSVVTSRKKKNG